jgi:hypothetical protein
MKPPRNRRIHTNTPQVFNVVINGIGITTRTHIQATMMSKLWTLFDLYPPRYDTIAPPQTVPVIGAEKQTTEKKAEATDGSSLSTDIMKSMLQYYNPETIYIRPLIDIIIDMNSKFVINCHIISFNYCSLSFIKDASAFLGSRDSSSSG